MHLEENTVTPSALSVKKRQASEAAASNELKFWPVDTKELRVHSMSSKPELFSRVLNVASEWTLYSGISLRPVERIEESDIRISFRGTKCDSLVGTEATEPSNRNKSTMHLGGVANLSTSIEDKKKFRRKVLHEFGHVFGLIHEHQSPFSPVKWEESVVFPYFKNLGWNEQKIRRNILNRKQFAYYRPFDSNSIMLYPIPR